MDCVAHCEVLRNGCRKLLSDAKFVGGNDIWVCVPLWHFCMMRLNGDEDIPICNCRFVFEIEKRSNLAQLN